MAADILHGGHLFEAGEIAESRGFGPETYGSKALLERLNPAQSDQTFELPDAVVADILLEAGIPGLTDCLGQRSAVGLEH